MPARKGFPARTTPPNRPTLWKNGLASWGQSGERIQRLREAADFVIYTPGSTAGIPVSILKSFAAPPQAIMEDDELLRERINTTATSLLGLIGIEADPIKSREHILISTILDRAWSEGQDLDIAALIQQIQTPPVNKIGVHGPGFLLSRQGPVRAGHGPEQPAGRARFQHLAGGRAAGHQLPYCTRPRASPGSPSSPSPT